MGGPRIQRTSIRRRLGAITGAAALSWLVLLPSVAIAGSPSTGARVDDGGNSHGMLPKGVSRGGSVGPTGNFGSTADLEYHDGPVMRNVRNYLIFWNPAGSTFAANYRTIIEQYFTDIGSTPFMEVNSQFGDTSGTPVDSNNQLGGVWLDTANAYPHAGTVADPVLRADVQDEIDRAITANPTWQAPGLSTMYFVYLGQNIIECKGANDCFAGPGTTSANGKYCAYHSFYDTDKVFATMPYAASSTVCGSNAAYPNGRDVDLVISPTSHEQFEAYSDPHLDAWYDDTSGNENGDNCAYVYGQIEPDGTNFVLSGHRYQSQIEWNNLDPDGCVKRVLPASTPTFSGSLAFGVVARGTSVTKDLDIQNTGAADMNLLDVRFGGGAPSSLSITPPTPHVGTLAPGHHAIYHVTFAPSASATTASPFATTLIVDTDEPGFETQTAPISGSTGLPKGVTTPPSLQFGTVCPSSSTDLPFTVTNTGLAPLTITGVSLAGGSSSALSILALPTLPQTLPVGGHLDFTVRVTIAAGASAGAVTGTVLVDTDDPATPQVSVPISATIGAGVLTLSTTALDFGGVAVDDRTSPHTKDRTITLSNTGSCGVSLTGSLSITGPDGADFSIVGAPTLPLTIAAGSSTNIVVRFNPSAPGDRSGTLTLTPAAPLSSVDIALTGKGLTPAILTSPAALTFQPTVIVSQSPGYTGTTLDDVVTNTGQAELIVDGLATSGAPFFVTGPASPPSRYAASDHFTSTVRFGPTSVGKSTGSFTVSDTGTGVGPVSATVPLCGEGVKRGIRVLAVDANGVPFAKVARLKLQAHGTAQKVSVNASNLAPTSVTTSCDPTQQRHYENQSLPATDTQNQRSSYYVLAVTAGGKSTTITFTLGVTEFKTIVITIK